MTGLRTQYDPRMRSEDTNIVLHVAALARLQIDAEEAAAFGPQLAATLAQFEALSAADVEGIEPMTSAAAGFDVVRADEPVPSLPVDAALANAPARVEDFYRVPKTVGGDE